MAYFTGGYWGKFIIKKSKILTQGCPGNTSHFYAFIPLVLKPLSYLFEHMLVFWNSNGDSHMLSMRSKDLKIQRFENKNINKKERFVYWFIVDEHWPITI